MESNGFLAGQREWGRRAKARESRVCHTEASWSPFTRTCTVTPKNTPGHSHIFLFLRQADLNTNIDDEGSAFYGVSSQYESLDNMIITCSTKVCSFGKQVVEKVEVGGHLVGVGQRGWPVCPLSLELPPPV